MIRLATLLFATLLVTLSLHAREATLPYSRRNPVQPLANVPQITTAPTDAISELAIDARAGGTTPLRVASGVQLAAGPSTHGSWEEVAGGRLWRLRIFSAGATDLSLGFSRFQLPEGATMHLYSEADGYTQGAFTARDNKPHGELWTPVLPGDRLVIELFVPTGARDPVVVLTQVNRGYRDLFRRKKDGPVTKAGACNNDVVCSLGNPWRNEIRAVAMYTVTIGGSTFQCTGTLINNVAGNYKNFFLTADHCGIAAANASSVVVYWNYQSPNCGQHNGGSLAQNQSGATFRMSRADVDVALIELEDVPETSYQVYYSGWDRSGSSPNGAVGIHHPSGDEKSISFANAPITTTDSCIGNGNNTHWNVIWNSGVTEEGSSGSGLWDSATRRLIGTLSGGESLCATPTSPDCYGKFSVAWNGTSAASRLRDWLDPLNSGAVSAPGLDLITTPSASGVDLVLASESCTPTNGVIDPGELIALNFTLRNAGNKAFTNLVGTLLPGTGVHQPGPAQSYGAISVNGPNVMRTFTCIATGACGGTVSVRIQLQEGTLNVGTITNTFVLGTPNVVFAENFDTAAPPVLPPGWTNFKSGAGSLWVATGSTADTLPNSIFAPAPTTVSEEHITSPPIPIGVTNAEIAFRHKYSFEKRYDGGVLELAIGSGPFIDITNGGTFLNNGYNTDINANYFNPLAGRGAWSDVVTNFVTSRARLPAAAAGQDVRFRWRVGTDSSTGANGWWVDSITVSDGFSCCSAAVAPTLVNLRRTADNFAFSFASVAGRTYEVEYKGSLSESNWQTLQTLTGDGLMKHFTNSSVTTNRYLRLRTP